MDNKINGLSANQQGLPSTAKQGSLNLVVEKEVDGVGMGVLSDGTPFLTMRGLARLCGVHHTVIGDINSEWNSEVEPPRIKKIREIFKSHGNDIENLYFEMNVKGVQSYIYSDEISIAILEYYAFDAGQNVKDEAKRNFRLLAGKALRDFIYTQVGYDPKQYLPPEWKAFHDRVSLTYDSVPSGYFGVFKEIADLIVTIGQSGLHIDSKFVPDISVGLSWGKFWISSRFDDQYGPRIKFEHNYPSYFPQAASNPQEPWCYPESALGEFRRWFRDQYIKNGQFKKYLESKVRDNSLPVSFAQLALGAVQSGIEKKDN